MVPYRLVKRDARPDKSRGAYVLIVRGPDGRPRAERFTDVASYRTRLLSLQPSEDSSISIDEIAGLLDT
jgi:hypothetical protein